MHDRTIERTHGWIAIALIVAGLSASVVARTGTDSRGGGGWNASVAGSNRRGMDGVGSRGGAGSADNASNCRRLEVTK